MKKIPTLFKRDFTQKNHPITPVYNEGTEWVLRGEGVATRKYDGMCCMIRDGKLYKRCEVRPGKIAPAGFEQVAVDQETGKAYGWVQVGWGSEDKYFREAIFGANPDKTNKDDGTYELIGPKVQGNPEGLFSHTLKPHADAERLSIDQLDFDSLKMTLEALNIEGIVWHHPDGRMVKLKKKDFGMKRQTNAVQNNHFHDWAQRLGFRYDSDDDYWLSMFMLPISNEDLLALYCKIQSTAQAKPLDGEIVRALDLIQACKFIGDDGEEQLGTVGHEEAKAVIFDHLQAAVVEAQAKSYRAGLNDLHPDMYTQSELDEAVREARINQLEQLKHTEWYHDEAFAAYVDQELQQLK